MNISHYVNDKEMKLQLINPDKLKRMDLEGGCIDLSGRRKLIYFTGNRGDWIEEQVWKIYDGRRVCRQTQLELVDLWG